MNRLSQRLHDDGRTPRPRAVDVKAQSTDIDKSAARRIAVVFPLRRSELK